MRINSILARQMIGKYLRLLNLTIWMVDVTTHIYCVLSSDWTLKVIEGRTVNISCPKRSPRALLLKSIEFVLLVTLSVNL